MVIIITTYHATTPRLLWFTSTHCQSGCRKYQYNNWPTTTGICYSSVFKFLCVQCFTRQNFMDQPNVVQLSFRKFLFDCLATCIDFYLGPTQQVPLSFNAVGEW
jgi:hypothetical protein